VPPTGFPAGEVDARLREAVIHGWRRTALLTTALGEPVAPSEAVRVAGLDPDTTLALAQALPGLLPDGPPGAATAARVLGVDELTIAEAVDALAALVRPPAFWHRIYQGLAGFDTESLTGLPVPLADRRQVIGARGLLLPEPSSAAVAVRASAVLAGLRMVHPQAVHPLLERLGAVPADPDALLTSAALVDEIARWATDLDEGSIEPGDLDEIAVDREIAAHRDPGDTDEAPAAEAGPAGLAVLVLELIAAGGRGDPAVLAELVLTDIDGEPWPAGGLMLAESALRNLVAEVDLPNVHPLWSQRWAPEVLAATGIRDTLVVIGLDDPRADDLLPDLDLWFETPDAEAMTDASAPAIADLVLIADDSWPELLALVARDPTARAALFFGGSSPSGRTRSYSAWWLRRHVRIEGRRPGANRLPDADELAGLYDLVPSPDQGRAGLDPAIAAAIGVLSGLDAAIESDPQLLLDRFCAPDRTLPPSRVPALTQRLVEVLGAHADLALPETVRTLAGTVVAAGEALVPDGPWWAQVLLPEQLMAPGDDPDRTAAVFEVDTAARHHRVSLDGAGADPADSETTDRMTVWVDSVVRALELDRAPAGPRLQPGLAVRLDGGDPRPVRWWPGEDGRPLVDGSQLAVADAVAFSAGRYSDRLLARAAVLGELGPALIESAFVR
jgi:hypothetical protein